MDKIGYPISRKPSVIRKLSYKLKSGDFSVPFPIGTSDEYVKMLSNYSLTEEFYLGPPALTRFTNKDDGTFEIIQEFIDINSEDVDTNGFKFYELRTTFEEDTASQEGGMKIIQTLRHCIENVDDEAGEIQSYTKQIINKKIITFGTDDNGETSITEEYENGDYPVETWAWGNPPSGT